MESEISKVIQAETMEEAITKNPFQVGQLFQVLVTVILERGAPDFISGKKVWVVIAKLVSREQPLSLETIRENMAVLRGK